jgi:hydrogenase maturation protease
MLVACIGNIFLGDDGFGCEVARALARMTLPPEIRVVDYGIRGLDVVYALLGPYEKVILVDAAAHGSPPGTIYILQPVVESGEEIEAIVDAHSMQLVHLMAMAQSLGEITAEIYIVGCEPLDFGSEEDGRMGLSDAVKASVAEAARVVMQLTPPGVST